MIPCGRVRTEKLSQMRRRLIVDPRRAILVACFLAFAALVGVAGWSWPLELAAVLFPVAALLLS